MTPLALALVLCLDLDGTTVQVTLADPLVVTVTAAGPTIRLSRWDAASVKSALEIRGIAVAELPTFRLRGPSTEALACGECESGGFSRRWLACVPGLKASPCMSCRICADPLPEPIACGEAPSGGRVGR